MASNDAKTRNTALLAAGAGMLGVLTSMAVVFPRIDPAYDIAADANQGNSPFSAEEFVPSQPDPLSIALLPVTTEPGARVSDPALAQLTHDVTEELGELGLRVADNRAVAFLRNRAATPDHEQGRALGVRYVLAATVAGNENDLRVHATLTDCLTTRVLWKGTFWPRRPGDFEDTETEIAMALKIVLPLDKAPATVPGL